MTEPTFTANEDWVEPLFDAIVSVFQRVGYFDKVNTHEPKRKPGHGITAAVWFDRMYGVGDISGLDASTALTIFTGRIYSNMLREPQDMIDPMMTKAGASVMRQFHGNYDFGLHPRVRNVDLLGETGVQLIMVAGYLEQAKAMYRVYDITIPVIVNDVFAQAA